MMCAYNPSTGETENLEDPGIPWQESLAYLVSSKPGRGSVSKKMR